MKKLIILMFALLIVSCTKDDCVIKAQKQFIGNYTIEVTDSTGRAVMTTIITEDTCFSEDKIWSDAVRINSGVTVIVNGNSRINGSNLLLLSTAHLIVTNDIEYVNTVFFVNEGGGKLTVGGDIFISNDANANSGASGTITYCTSTGNIITTGDVTLVQDCTPLENTECETLSDDGLDSQLGAIVDVPCSYDFVNQKVKVDENGNSYIYLKVD